MVLQARPRFRGITFATSKRYALAKRSALVQSGQNADPVFIWDSLNWQGSPSPLYLLYLPRDKNPRSLTFQSRNSDARRLL